MGHDLEPADPSLHNILKIQNAFVHLLRFAGYYDMKTLMTQKPCLVCYHAHQALQGKVSTRKHEEPIGDLVAASQIELPIPNKKWIVLPPYLRLLSAGFYACEHILAYDAKTLVLQMLETMQNYGTSTLSFQEDNMCLLNIALGIMLINKS